MYSDEENKKAISDGTLIFNTVYDTSITEEFFAHKHFRNPFLVDTPFLIDYSGDKAVVMRWMMGMDVSFGDQHFKAVQTSDDAVLPDEKGIKFIKVVKNSEKIMKNDGVSFVYGCFYPGTAMGIATKLGEKNIVNMYTARLPLSDTIYSWKRFKFSLPKFAVKFRASQLVKKLKHFSVGCDSKIEISESRPFTEADYSIINSEKALRVSRSDPYYDWKLGLKKKSTLKYIVARKKGKLVGFVIAETHSDKDIIVDWEVFLHGEERKSTLAAMLLKFCRDKSIVVPSLNPESGEMDFFTEIGFSNAKLSAGPVCICAKAFDENITDIIYNAKNWKHRFIDADYFLN